MKKSKILLIISFAPAVITAVSLLFMNDIVPMHYNMNGEIDRWGSKYENFIFPAIIVVFYLFWVIYIKFHSASSIDNVEKTKCNINVLYIIAISIVSALGVLQCVFLMMAFAKSGNLSFNIDVFFIINCVFGIAFIVIGNFLPRVKQNNVLGVHFKWARKDEKAWLTANRYGGAALAAVGLLTIVESSFIKGAASTCVMVSLLVVSSAAAYILAFIKCRNL